MALLGHFNLEEIKSLIYTRTTLLPRSDHGQAIKESSENIFCRPNEDAIGHYYEYLTLNRQVIQQLRTLHNDIEQYIMKLERPSLISSIFYSSREKTKKDAMILLQNAVMELRHSLGDYRSAKPEDPQKPEDTLRFMSSQHSSSSHYQAAKLLQTALHNKNNANIYKIICSGKYSHRSRDLFERFNSIANGIQDNSQINPNHPKLKQTTALLLSSPLSLRLNVTPTLEA